MNKLQQAIAYLVSKIKQAYHAARFSLSIITSEFPNDRRRMDGRPRNEPSYLRNADSQSVATHTDRSGEGYSPSSTCGTARTCSDATSGSSDDSCCGVLGGLNRDLAHRFGYSHSEDTSRAEGAITKDLQNRKDFSRKDEIDRAWDLLEQCDRMSNILTVLWQEEQMSRDRLLLTTSMVMEMCDIADQYWDLTFADLMALNRQDKICIKPIYKDDSYRYFLGFFWGLK